MADQLLKPGISLSFGCPVLNNSSKIQETIKIVPLDKLFIETDEQTIQKLNKAHVLIAGLGGVGSHAAEAICRAGIGNITIADHDVINITNLNRQLCALITAPSGNLKWM